MSTFGQTCYLQAYDIKICAERSHLLGEDSRRVIAYSDPNKSDVPYPGMGEEGVFILVSGEIDTDQDS